MVSSRGTGARVREPLFSGARASEQWVVGRTTEAWFAQKPACQSPLREVQDGWRTRERWWVAGRQVGRPRPTDQADPAHQTPGSSGAKSEGKEQEPRPLQVFGKMLSSTRERQSQGKLSCQVPGVARSTGQVGCSGQSGRFPALLSSLDDIRFFQSLYLLLSYVSVLLSFLPLKF